MADDPNPRLTPVKKRVTDSFERGTDGRWTCIEAVTLDLSTRSVPIKPGAVFGPEDSFMGVKVAKLLDSLVETRRAA